ncbi:hypothetical protein MSSAC_3440 [Methanosarcina siciliae C2J]|uniref:Uncharacterized protein n=1 Tax=Methanosarcina siciliae C2J TaxID=1434118 RepID=A0A0E3PRS5_9EURY|nr:hypothetical protein MSSAC_3440 [Methanosarcina siciliae C2J]
MPAISVSGSTNISTVIGLPDSTTLDKGRRVTWVAADAVKVNIKRIVIIVNKQIPVSLYFLAILCNLFYDV